eukprot:symbB.v1.2.037974.t1/scaffold5765.1/size23854/2
MSGKPHRPHEACACRAGRGCGWCAEDIGRMKSRTEVILHVNCVVSPCERSENKEGVPHLLALHRSLSDDRRRNRALQFSKGATAVGALFATDLAARGMDFASAGEIVQTVAALLQSTGLPKDYGLLPLPRGLAAKLRQKDELSVAVRTETVRERWDVLAALSPHPQPRAILNFLRVLMLTVRGKDGSLESLSHMK